MVDETWELLRVTLKFLDGNSRYKIQGFFPFILINGSDYNRGGPQPVYLPTHMPEFHLQVRHYTLE